MAFPAGAAAATGLGIVAGLAQATVGIINSGKTKREAKQLAATRPKYSISPYAGEDVSQAESDLANGGMSSEAEKAYNEGVDRQSSQAYDALLKGGGDPNNIGAIYDQGIQGQQRIAILKDQQRLNYINNLVRAHDYYNDQLDKQWSINVDQPWKDDAQANAAAREKANNMIWSGINTAVSAGMGGLNSMGKLGGNTVGTSVMPYTPQTQTVPTTSYQPAMISPNAITHGPSVIPQYYGAPMQTAALPPTNYSNYLNQIFPQ